MDDGVVQYSGSTSFPDYYNQRLDSRSWNGLSWTISKSLDYPATEKSAQQLYLKWEFDWSYTDGIDGYEGHISIDRKLNWKKKNIDIHHQVNVRIAAEQKTVEHCLLSYDSNDTVQLEYKIHLKPFENEDQSAFEKIFESSEMTDTILVVEKKKMHVNKGILSFHSAYFRTLFNSEFKEKSMKEIPIKDVKYSEFARLLSVISPNPTFATEGSCESLLELADRFMMPSVTRHVEHFLLTNSDFAIQPIKLQPARILKLAERFKLPNVTRHVEKSLLKGSMLRFCHVLSLAEGFELNELLGAMITWISCKEHMKKIKESSEYADFSDVIKIRLFERFADI